MHATELKNPGLDQLGQTTRFNVAKLISNARNEANPTSEVAAFLLDAATKAPGYSPPAPPATSVVVASGVKIPVGTVTGTGTFGTFTIVGGVITGIVLSDE